MRQAGFTLIELSVGVAVMSLVLVVMSQSLQSSQDAMNEFTVIAVTDDRARRVVDRIGEELRYANTSSFSPAAPSADSVLNFQPVEGWNDDGAILGVARSIELVGNQVQIAGQTIATDVTTLSLTLDGGVLRVVVGLQANVTSGVASRTISRNVESVVELLN